MLPISGKAALYNHAENLDCRKTCDLKDWLENIKYTVETTI